MTVLMIGDTVDCVIGANFLPNGTGAPIPLSDRSGGEVIAFCASDGHPEVRWPNGSIFCYETALLVKR